MLSCDRQQRSKEELQSCTAPGTAAVCSWRSMLPCNAPALLKNLHAAALNYFPMEMVAMTGDGT